ncbi:MAG: YchF/TatD family DNA exonuclease [Acidimicrobiia bacterium]|nr:YchF/TatD family DNA exonuclease [Acidimicrobiia bacterium]
MNVSWVDTHCHLSLDERDPKELIAEADDVVGIVIPGVDLRSSVAAVELAARYPDRLGAAVGVHPHDSVGWEMIRNEISDLTETAVAVGETGLDYYRDHAPRDTQRASFAWHIELATERDLPLIVHCRDAFADVYRMISESGSGELTVLHCWTGGTRWTRRFLELGVMFSYAGPITFTTGETIRLGAELVPPDRALVETDTPYLAPEPHRGEPNRPAWVRHTGAELARVWGLSVEEVAATTTENARRVFGVPG